MAGKEAASRDRTLPSCTDGTGREGKGWGCSWSQYEARIRSSAGCTSVPSSVSLEGRSFVHACAHTHTHAHTRHMHTHAHRCTHPHACRYKHIHNTQTCKSVCICTHVHTYTHNTCIQSTEAPCEPSTELLTSAAPNFLARQDGPCPL